jgi:hypothetical protein
MKSKYQIPSLRAKRSNPSCRKMDCFAACAPLRKRFAVAAGNDGKGF